jgi:tRNA nucleotidyltransferase (CCA-adding enzyme)
VALVEALCDRLKIPNAYRELAVLVSRYHLDAHRITELRDNTLLELLERLDAFRRPARFEQWVLACEADARGRKGLENREYPQADHLRGARDIVAKVTLDPAERDGLDGTKIAEKLRKARLAALTSQRRS